jgi:glycosyltransferase involved in cell wall biosynthesis
MQAEIPSRPRIRVIGFALYGPLAASHRVRLSQYKNGLNKLGVDLEIDSLLGDSYVRGRFRSKRYLLYALVSFFGRIKNIFFDRNFDIAIIHCELIPLLPSWVERFLLRRPYIYDFDDAFYLRYRQGGLKLLRPLLGNKFDSVISRAGAVTAGSASLAAYARHLNSHTTVLPSVVDTNVYAPSIDKHNINNAFTVGWIGSPTTSTYLSELVEPLSRIARESFVRFIVIGGSAPDIPGVDVVEKPWSSSQEVNLINSFDVGLMPLPNTDWTRGKCAFKLVQFMACGLPVIASRVGANIDLVSPACGFLVNDAAGWVSALQKLRDEPLLREQMGMAARKRIVEYYSLERNLPVLFEVIQRVALGETAYG